MDVDGFHVAQLKRLRAQMRRDVSAFLFSLILLLSRAQDARTCPCPRWATNIMTR